MVRNLLASVLALVLALGITRLQAQSLGPEERAKLHPRFQELVERRAASPLAKGVITPGLAVTQRSDGRTSFEAIIQTQDPGALEQMGIHLNSVFHDFATALVTEEELVRLAQSQTVRSVMPGSENFIATDRSLTEIGASALHGGIINNTPYKGSGVIVLVYDSGIDWAHLDFRDPADSSKSRILAIWDQTITATGGESPPAGFSYGVEYTKAQIENELDGTPAGFVREQDYNGHGTHVMGTAAGNGKASNGRYIGVAPLADLVVVKGGEGSFTENRMIDGLTYAQNIASSQGKPVAVNWSIGGHSGPHDGTRPYEQAVNTFVATPGRVVVISAGNDGASPIHLGGTLTAGGSATFTMTVPTYTPTSGTNNDRFVLDVWLDGNLNVTALVTSPNGHTYQRLAGEWGSSQTADGTIYVQNLISTLNGDRNIYCEIYDGTPTTPATGTWTVTLSGAVSNVAYDAWLASRTVGASLVTLTSGNTALTVSMPGTAEGAITVASYVTKWSWESASGSTYSYSGTDRTDNISTFSSIGPSRDLRQKPDIAAPGQGIAAALSSASIQSAVIIVPGGKHFINQGTSMAAPHVAGAAALMLGADASLTSAEIKNAMLAGANKDAFTGPSWNVTWGEGKLDVLEAMASTLYSGGTASQPVLSYASAPALFLPLPGGLGTGFGVRFTAPFDGRVIALKVLLNGGASGIKGTGNLAVKVAQNASGSVGGIPGTQIGTTVSVPFSHLVGGTWNTIDLTSAQASAALGTEFHITMEVAGAAGDTVQLLVDNDVANRTSRSSGLFGSWMNFADASYFNTGYNLLVKAVVAGVTDVERVSEIVPDAMELGQNYPNPFNPSTVIRYSLPHTADVHLTVYDLMGREVATLVSGRQLPGVYETRWDGTTTAGTVVASGIYFYSLQAGEMSQTRKMVLVK